MAHLLYALVRDKNATRVVVLSPISRLSSGGVCLLPRSLLRNLLFVRSSKVEEMEMEEADVSELGIAPDILERGQTDRQTDGGGEVKVGERQQRERVVYSAFFARTHTAAKA